MLSDALMPLFSLLPSVILSYGVRLANVHLVLPIFFVKQATKQASLQADKLTSWQAV